MPRELDSSSYTLLREDPPSPPDLTATLDLYTKHILAIGSFSVVYRCKSYSQDIEVVVKAIVFPSGFDPTEKKEFARKVRRELGLWRRLDHPNIIPLLGITSGNVFGSDYPCMVLASATNGALLQYIEQRGTVLSLPDRIKLIKGSAGGLEYLHSRDIIHGDFHPGNILIDDDHNPRLTDFRLSQTLCRKPPQSPYLYTHSTLWSAPELVFPELYPKLKFQATLHSDIYSLGSITLLILSGKCPWKGRVEAQNNLKEFQNPPRPTWPVNLPDGVWDFIKQCWSPRSPESRPSAREVLSFCTDRLKQLLQPNINVVLFGAVGSGKSSIINLLAGEPIALEFSGVGPCTKRPRSYHVSIDDNPFCLWDTMGFSLMREGSANHLLPHEQAHTVLRNLPGGVNLILICVHKNTISHSLRRLYWLINDFFLGGCASMAFVVTHFDTPDEGWWECNKRHIAERTSIPTKSIPHACITTDPTGRDQSKHALKLLLQTHATAVNPVFLRPDLSYYMTTSLDLTIHCGLSPAEAAALVKKFNRRLRPFNIVFFGETDGIDSIVNPIAGRPVTESRPGARAYTLGSPSCGISTGMQRFCIWDTTHVNGVHINHDVHMPGASENARLLVHDLSNKGGIDLLVFCKRFGHEFTEKEVNSYRLFEETLRRGQFPVAAIVTHYESQYPMEKWWEMNGKKLIKSIGGNVIGYTCIPPLANYDRDDNIHDKARVESRISIEVMLEDCVSSRRARPLSTRIEEVLKMGSGGWHQEKMNVKNHRYPYELTRQKTI